MSPFVFLADLESGNMFAPLPAMAEDLFLEIVGDVIGKSLGYTYAQRQRMMDVVSAFSDYDMLHILARHVKASEDMVVGGWLVNLGVAVGGDRASINAGIAAGSVVGNIILLVPLAFTGIGIAADIAIAGIELGVDIAVAATELAVDVAEGAASTLGFLGEIGETAAAAAEVAGEAAAGAGEAVGQGVNAAEAAGEAAQAAESAASEAGQNVANGASDLADNPAMEDPLGNDAPDECIDNRCFLAGTQVVVAMPEEISQDEDSELIAQSNGSSLLLATPKTVAYLTQNIEKLKVGDLVLARDQFDADAPLILRQVESVVERIGYQLTIVTIRSSTGHEHKLYTTNEHPVYVPGRGWVVSRDLCEGDELVEPPGGISTVIASRYERHPRGITVYNLIVAESHTYYVREQDSTAEPVWVHNGKCGPEVESLDQAPQKWVDKIRQAANLFGELPELPKVGGRLKQVALAAGEETPFVSGQTRIVPGFQDPQSLIGDVMDIAKEMGYELPASGAADNLGPGSWFAGHAEKFASLFGNVIATTPLENCANCVGWFEKLSSWLNETYYVADAADQVRVFSGGVQRIFKI